ncbi:HesA/MoeB/ThiF family protein [Arachidicoccus sp.]|uniref:HesA/MoeB/ThiF family protein n=1 Tax=Arachidicoccus sp. TaxID=1872624 RepID=UPI003D1E208A
MELSEDLRLARRKLATLEGYELLEDFSWDAVSDKWVLKFRIMCGTTTVFVPEITDWYLIASPAYPLGKIDIYPAAENGLAYTFPHQSYNDLRPNAKWRTGNICVSTSVGLWGKRYFNNEPYDAESRLCWHILRCKDWIAAAANGSLVVNGDPFEMPSFKKESGQMFVFNEDEDTFTRWSEYKASYGTFTAKEVFANWPVYPILNFKSHAKEVQYKWGNRINQSRAPEVTNLWVMLDKLPVLPPWQVPSTWGQLFSVVKEQGIDLKGILKKDLFKAGKNSYKFLLVGFPIPRNVGEDNCRIFWLSISLPSAPSLSGFRRGSEALQSAQFKIMFKDEAVVKWANTENWNKAEITSRGKMNTSINNLRFVIIGAGAIGSNLSELLLRLGCDNLTILDRDLLNIGNLSRHTLTMDKVHSCKVVSLAERLNSIFPSANVKPISKDLDHHFNSNALMTLVQDTDIFIDATGDDTLINFIGGLLSGTKAKFISVSTGFAAKRLFCFMADTEQCSLEKEFTQALAPWLKKDEIENPDPQFPREGIGCWHPIFPARIDDIWLLLATAVKRIEKFLEASTVREFVVIEQEKDEEGYIMSVKIIED